MKKLIYNISFLVLAAFAVSACNKSDGGGGGGGSSAADNCGGGSVYSSQYGCLQQGNCQQGFGMYNSNGVSQCVPATNGNGSGNVWAQTPGAYPGYNNGYNNYYGFPSGNYSGNNYYSGWGYSRYCYFYWGRVVCN